MKCLFCDETATCCTTAPEGVRPENPKHEGTQADHRRVVIRHACNEHAKQLGLKRLNNIPWEYMIPGLQ